MNLTIENLIDLREAVSRRLQEVSAADFKLSPARKEQNRRKDSLRHNLQEIESEIKDLQFEEERKPGYKKSDDIYLCPTCNWEGFEKDLNIESLGERVNLTVCPVCADHNLKKI